MQPTSSTSIQIAVAKGDGIGPEIMEATLHILKAAGARLEIETIEIGEQVYLRGDTAGIPASAWESLRRTKVFLKARDSSSFSTGLLRITALRLLKHRLRCQLSAT